MVNSLFLTLHGCHQLPSVPSHLGKLLSFFGHSFSVSSLWTVQTEGDLLCLTCHSEVPQEHARCLPETFFSGREGGR